MTTDTRTPKHRLLDVLIAQKLGKRHTLASHVDKLRAAGTPRRKIPGAIEELTGEDVTEQSLINWGLLAPKTTEGGAA